MRKPNGATGLFLAGALLAAETGMGQERPEASNVRVNSETSETHQQIQRLIDDLGDDDFHRREAAHAELRRRGGPFLDMLNEHSLSSDPDVRWRVKNLLDSFSINACMEGFRFTAPSSWSGSGTPPTVRDVITELGKQMGEPIQTKNFSECVAGFPVKENMDGKLLLEVLEILRQNLRGAATVENGYGGNIRLTYPERNAPEVVDVDGPMSARTQRRQNHSNALLYTHLRAQPQLRFLLWHVEGFSAETLEGTPLEAKLFDGSSQGTAWEEIGVVVSGVKKSQQIRLRLAVTADVARTERTRITDLDAPMDIRTEQFSFRYDGWKPTGSGSRTWEGEEFYYHDGPLITHGEHPDAPPQSFAMHHSMGIHGMKNGKPIFIHGTGGNNERSTSYFDPAYQKGDDRPDYIELALPGRKLKKELQFDIVVPAEE